MIGVVIRQEAADDLEAIKTVHRLAVEGDEEARLVSALRAEGHARASLVAVVQGQVIGHIMFSNLPILAPDAAIPALPLAPLAVIPEKQGQGIGSALVREALQFCRTHGHPIVVVLGHSEF